MKKTYRILLAGLAALAVFSCNKDVKPAAPMSCEEVQKKLSDVAVATIKEVDPDNYKAWGQSAIKLYTDYRTIGAQSEELDLDEMMVKTTEEESEGTEIITNIIRLSLLKGDVTVVDNKFVYKESENPFNMTIPSDGKTYKIQMECAGENGDGIILTESTRTMDEGTRIRRTGIVVPQKAAAHITQDGKQFMDIEIYPVIEDNNKSGMLDGDDVIKGHATVVIPGYSLTLNDFKATNDGITAALALMHGNTSVLSINGEVELETIVQDLKSLTKAEAEFETIPGDIKGNISLMGGQAIVKASIDAEDLWGVPMNYSSESEAKKAVKVFNENAKADLYFDNNPTIQASLCFMVEKTSSEEEGDSWNVIPGFHFYDGASGDMTYKEFLTSFTSNQEAFSPLMEAAAGFMGKFAAYFPELMPKEK
jgi:hypothetical protein